jgi:hypothetical protein
LELGTGETHGKEEFDDGRVHRDHGLTMSPFRKTPVYRNPQSDVDLGFINSVEMNVALSHSGSTI